MGCFVRRCLVLGLAVLLNCGLFARAATAPDAEALLAQMMNADPALQSYRANVEFSVGLYSFPFLRKTVHGEAFFKRPGHVQLVFSDLPAIAQRFRQVYVGLGSPAEWQRKFDISASEATVGGQTVPKLTLTPKVDRRLKRVDVYLDPRSSLPTTFVWRYSDGTIRMTQQIVEVDGHSVVTAQAADIKLPGVHAFVNSHLTNVQVNAAFEDSVFTKVRPAPAE
jgi:outer membrane lipoprotein-sorting protein